MSLIFKLVHFWFCMVDLIISDCLVSLWSFYSLCRVYCIIFQVFFLCKVWDDDKLDICLCKHIHLIAVVFSYLQILYMLLLVKYLVFYEYFNFIKVDFIHGVFLWYYNVLNVSKMFIWLSHWFGCVFKVVSELYKLLFHL